MGQKLLTKLVNSNPQETIDIVNEILLLKGYTNIIRTKDYLLAEGDKSCPVACVCHADTVFDNSFKEQREVYHDKEKNVAWCIPTGGMDDKLGINILLKIIVMTEYRPSVIICDGEENFCMGAQKLVQDFPTCPFDVKYLLELDRANEKDCVFYHPPTEEFQKYIESFGWITANGVYSDIYMLEPAWGIPSTNVSIGYLRQHTQLEHFRVDWATASMKRVQLMLADAAKAPRHTSNAKIEYSPLSDKTCIVCEKNNVTESVKFDEDIYFPVCKKCRDTLDIEKCSQCHEYFWSDKRQLYCDKCGKEEFKF